MPAIVEQQREQGGSRHVLRLDALLRDGRTEHVTEQRLAFCIYARYSSDLQNPRSCEDQVIELRQAVESRGGRFDPHLVFSDAEVSGGIWERSGLQELLLAVEAGRVRRIFVEDLSRLSRDKEDAARIEKLLAYRDVAIVTLDGMVYDGSAGSSLAFTFRSASAAQYLRDLGAKTRRGLRGAHREGNSTGGRCFGLRESLTRTRILEAVSQAIATPKAAAYIRHRLAERAGTPSSEARRELEDRTARLTRVTERISRAHPYASRRGPFADGQRDADRP